MSEATQTPPPAAPNTGTQPDNKTTTPPAPADGISKFITLMKQGSEAAETKPTEAKPEENKTETPAPEDKTEKTETPPEKPPKKEGEEKPTAAPKKKVIKSNKFDGVVDPLELAKTTAKETGKALGKEIAEAMKEKHAAAPTEEVELNKEEKRQLRVLSKLEETNPEEYKGIGTRFKKAVNEIARLDESREEWSAKNDAEDWDEYRRNEHEKILERNKVIWDDGDFEDARLALATEPLAKELKEAKQKLSQYESKTAAEEVKPKAEAAAVASAVELGRELVGDSAKDLIGDGFKMNKENREKLMESDPVAAPIIVDAMGRVASFSAAVEEVWHGTANKEVTNHIAGYCLQLERKILSMPADQRVMGGRRFSPLDAYYKLKPDERADYWTIDPDFVRSAFKDDVLERARPAIDAERKRFEAWEKRNGKVPAAAAKADEKPAAPAQPAKPVSPSTGAPGTPPPASNNKPATETGGKFFNFLRQGSAVAG